MRFCEIELFPAMDDAGGVDFSNTHEDGNGVTSHYSIPLQNPDLR